VGCHFSAGYLNRRHILDGKKAPTGFIPTEDQGFILYAVNTPPGSSLDRTQKAMTEIDNIVKQDPAADKRYTIDGLNFISNANASPFGAGFIRVKPYGERGGRERHQSNIQRTVAESKPGKRCQYVFLHFLPTIQGLGM
jgi:HAE1 family hydrophobic/amphiphilic exporter-1